MIEIINYFRFLGGISIAILRYMSYRHLLLLVAVFPVFSVQSAWAKSECASCGRSGVAGAHTALDQAFDLQTDIPTTIPDVDGSCSGHKPDVYVQLAETISSSKFGASGYRSNYVKLPNGKKVRTSMYGDVDFHSPQGRARTDGKDSFLADPVLLSNPTEVVLSGETSLHVYSQEGKLLRNFSLNEEAPPAPDNDAASDSEIVSRFTSKSSPLVLADKLISYQIKEGSDASLARLVVYNRAGKIVSKYDAGKNESIRRANARGVVYPNAAYFPFQSRIMRVNETGQFAEILSTERMKEQLGSSANFEGDIIRIDDNRMAVGIGSKDTLIFNRDGEILSRIRGSGFPIAMLDGKLLTYADRPGTVRLFNLNNPAGPDCLGWSSFADDEAHYLNWFNGAPIETGKEVYLPATGNDGALTTVVRVNPTHAADVTKYGEDELSRLGFHAIHTYGLETAKKWGKKSLFTNTASQLAAKEAKYGELSTLYSDEELKNYPKDLLQAHSRLPKKARDAMSLRCMERIAAELPEGLTSIGKLPEIETGTGVKSACDFVGWLEFTNLSGSYKSESLADYMRVARTIYPDFMPDPYYLALTKEFQKSETDKALIKSVLRTGGQFNDAKLSHQFKKLAVSTIREISKRSENEVNALLTRFKNAAVVPEQESHLKPLTKILLDKKSIQSESEFLKGINQIQQHPEWESLLTFAKSATEEALQPELIRRGVLYETMGINDRIYGMIYALMLTKEGML